MTHEEAIDIVRKNYPHVEVSGSQFETALRNLIPELRESEDERMVREFNDWLCEEIECRTNDLRDEKDRRTLNMLCYVLTKVKDWLEKQKDHFRDDTKMVELQDYFGFNDLERAVHRGFLSAGVENVPVTIIKETAQECLEQMKPAEWSEEDEIRLTNTLIMLKEYAIHHYSKDDVNKSVDWLENRFKSLRPQPHWKPSNEQINYLGAAVIEAQRRHNESTDGFSRYRVLKELYEQLLKL